MSVIVKFSCDGCATQANGTGILSRRNQDPQQIAPKGWMAFDPYTGCCYCPMCWGKIENGDA